MPPLLLHKARGRRCLAVRGMWCKLLGGVPLQVDVVEAVPLIGRQAARHGMLRTIGVVECALAVWVLTGWQPF